MNDIYYIRDFSEKLGLANINPIERLLLSCTLTKFIDRDERDSVEILFSLTKTFNNDAYRKWKCYEEYVKADDNIKQSSRSFLFDNVLNAAKENIDSLHYVKLDISKLNADGRSSLTSLAFKAFVVGASMHTCKEENVNWFDIPIFYWSKASSYSVNRICSEIEKWLEDVKIYCRLERKTVIHIFNKKKQSSMHGDKYFIDFNSNTPSNIETSMEKKTKKKIEETPEEAEIRTSIEAYNDIYGEEKTTSKEEEMINKIKETAIEEASKSTPVEMTEEEIDQDAEYQKYENKYGVNTMAKFCRKFNEIFDFNAATKKIAEQYETTREVVMKFLETGYVDDKHGGIAMKKALKEEMRALKNKVECLTFDESWMNGKTAVGKIFKAWAYHCYPRLMRIN